MRQINSLINGLAIGTIMFLIAVTSTELVISGWDYFYGINPEFRIGLQSIGRQISLTTLAITWLLYQIPNKI